jgi:drug/metabolite transporter (DMT)-like permease
VSTWPADLASRRRALRTAGLLSGIAAGAWLGAAEAPAKLVSTGLSPVTVSLVMVCGVFLARWSVPALLQGTSAVGADVRHAPHLVVWAVLAGSLWSIANTLTVYAIRDVGLSIAFPLWNSNSLLGILWGALFFGELRGATAGQRSRVIGGTVAMCVGATLLALASTHEAAHGSAARGVIAAVGAGLLWGTMYIPYRKAYLTGISPLAFVTFFTVGELACMGIIALTINGPSVTASELAAARGVLFWLMLGGFIWVIGDLFQQYAAKYVGISRGIPLSNTNQLWGLLWGTLVFGELRRSGVSLPMVVAGSLIMALGAAAVALATTGDTEHDRWREAAEREADRYGVDRQWVRERLVGTAAAPVKRSWIDWVLVAISTAVFVFLARHAEAPGLAMDLRWVAILCIVTVALLVAAGMVLWRTTRFN